MAGSETIVRRHEQSAVADPTLDEAEWSVLICVLGTFRLLERGFPITLRAGGKGEVLLCTLALAQDCRLERDHLLELLWPGVEPARAAESLNSLVYSLHKLLRPALGGANPLLHAQGQYILNLDARIGIDAACFDALAQVGDRHARAGNRAGAAAAYSRALRFYRGDLCNGITTTQAMLERERLRARSAGVLAYLADYHYVERDDAGCLEYARRVLATDPCREDAHRLIMRCHLRRGERAQALRQFRICAALLRAEFDAEPEGETIVLYDAVRTGGGWDQLRDSAQGSG